MSMEDGSGVNFKLKVKTLVEVNHSITCNQ